MSYRSIHTFGSRGGTSGPPTPPRQTTYVEQFTSPDTTWTITHPLGTDTPLVALYDLNGYALGDADVYVPDNRTVIVSFAVPVAGRVVIQA